MVEKVYPLRPRALTLSSPSEGTLALRTPAGSGGAFTHPPCPSSPLARLTPSLQGHGSASHRGPGQPWKFLLQPPMCPGGTLPRVVPAARLCARGHVRGSVMDGGLRPCSLRGAGDAHPNPPPPSHTSPLLDLLPYPRLGSSQSCLRPPPPSTNGTPLARPLILPSAKSILAVPGLSSPPENLPT